MSKVGKELVVFTVLFIFLTLGMHMQQWISHPIEHVQHLSSSQFGLFHPLYFTLGVYLVLFVVRKLFSLIRNLFRF